MKINFNRVIEPLLTGPVHKATLYLDPKFVVKATRKRLEGNLVRGLDQTIIVTVGAPNYLERQFIKACKKSGEPFPIKKVQLKFIKK